MSTHAGGRWTANPDEPSDTRCRWQLCTQPVPYRFHQQGMHMCRDHGLLAWSIVNGQMQTDESPTPDPAEPQSPLDDQGFVYYVATGGLIKIGHTTDLEQRLAQYPPNLEILHIRVGDRVIEKAEHRRFDEWLTDGREWFEDCADVRQLISERAIEDPHWRELEAVKYYTPRKKAARSTRVVTRRIA